MTELLNKRLLGNTKVELLSGLTVALALVPEAVAFAFVAGVDPLVGLYAAFIVGLITAIFGGRPGMISGATGALAVVIGELVGHHGIQYLFAAVILMGIIQIGVGLLKLGKFSRFIPASVMIGFVNGLAIVIFFAQLGNFKVENSLRQLVWMSGNELYIMIGLVLLAMAIIHFLPKLTTAVPSSLAAIITVSLAANIFKLDVIKVGDLASVAGGLPTLKLPDVPFNFETLKIILPYSLILASIGLIESLMTLTLVDDLTDTRGKSNKECVGQGLANVCSGLISSMGGCAMIGQSIINIKSGGRKRLSGISAAVFLLLFILFASRLIESIPMAALTGVMFMVVIETFEWATFKIMRNVPKSDALVIVLVSITTVFTDLAVAVFTGIIISALVFAWKQGKKIDIEVHDKEEGLIEYFIKGGLFFGSARNFIEAFNANADPEEIIIDFKYARIYDHSAIEAINTIAEKYRKLDKTLHLRHLSPECYQLINNSKQIVEVNIMEDPKYHIADDILD